MLTKLTGWMPKITPARFALLVFCGAALAWLLWWLFLASFFASRYAAASTDSELARLGQTGDMFGGINALFAAFAFAGVAVAAYYQHLSWELLARQAEQADRRATREAFEPLFFRLQDQRARPSTLHVKGFLEPAAVEPFVDGTYAFEAVTAQIRTFVGSSFAYDGRQFKRDDIELDKLVNLYQMLYEDNESTLGPYWRSVYHSFRLVDLSGLGTEDKRLHAGIARASLSSSELLLMILNCQTHWGQGLKPLIERYALLKHIKRHPQKQSEDEFLARCFFSPAALGESDGAAPPEDIMLSIG